MYKNQNNEGEPKKKKNKNRRITLNDRFTHFEGGGLHTRNPGLMKRGVDIVAVVEADELILLPARVYLHKGLNFCEKAK